MGARVGLEVRVHRCQLMNLDTPNGFRNLTVGDGVHIGPGCILDLANALEIGSRATIAPGAIVLTHADAGHSGVATRFPRIDAPTAIGADAWVGAGAIILAGSHVGASAVVGAGSVVGEPVPPNSVVAGVPARPIGGVD